MPDDGRVYSDEEFAVILRTAAELATRSEAKSAPSTGLTLSEMKSAAAQAGLDPALVERAARILVARRASPLETLTGGALRHRHEARLPIELDDDQAEKLLSAIRIAGGVAGHRDVGHSSAVGLTWHDGGDVESLRVTARSVDGGTDVSIEVDRRGTLAILGVVLGIPSFMWVLFSVFALYPESPVLGVGGLLAGLGGAFAAARGYWSASTKRVQARIREVMEAIEET